MVRLTKFLFFPSFDAQKLFLFQFLASPLFDAQKNFQHHKIKIINIATIIYPMFLVPICEGSPCCISIPNNTQSSSVTRKGK